VESRAENPVYFALRWIDGKDKFGGGHLGRGVLRQRAENQEPQQGDSRNESHPGSAIDE
jgi:hypothetical protein